MNDLMKDKWNELNGEVRYQPSYPHERVVAWTFRNFPRDKSSQFQMLDAGCGAGRHALFWAAEGYQTFASDFSENAIDVLDVRAAEKDVSINSSVCSSSALTFDDAQFDAVLSFGVFCYLAEADKERFFSEMFRVMKTGALALIVLRSTEDDRAVRATYLGGVSYQLQVMGEGAPSDVENGMTMMHLSYENIIELCKEFKEVKIDKMIYTEGGGLFTNADWYIQLRK